MTDNTELQHLTRLGRQIAASCRRSRTRARLAVARVCARAARGGTEYISKPTSRSIRTAVPQANSAVPEGG